MERMDYTEDDDEEGGSRVSKNNQKANKLQIGKSGSSLRSLSWVVHGYGGSFLQPTIPLISRS